MGTWVVRGTAQSRVTFLDPRVHFGDILPGEPPRTLRVTARTHAPVSAVTAAATTRHVKASATPRVGAPGQYDVGLTPVAGLPPGPFAGQVDLTLTAPDGTKTTVRRIHYDGVLAAPVRASPTHLLFDRVAVGSARTADVVLIGPAPRTVVRVTADRPELTVAAAPEPAAGDGARVYRVTVRPRAPDSGSGTVTFVVRDAAGQEHMISVAAWFDGIPPEAAGRDNP